MDPSDIGFDPPPLDSPASFVPPPFPKSDPPADSNTWTMNPATGQAWTLADMNALEAGFGKYESNALLESETRVTQLYVTVAFPLSSYNYDDGPDGMHAQPSITGADAASFTYTPNGEVASKVQAGVTWTYAHNEAGLKATEDGVTTYFVYGSGLDPSGRRPRRRRPPRLWERHADRATGARRVHVSRPLGWP